jgi:catechol 2,3-dioxygenase-like lactoylglutathione lyase family enzyme
MKTWPDRLPPRVAGPRATTVVAAVVLAGLLCGGAAALDARAPLVARVASVGMTVADADRSVAFFTGVLSFDRTDEREVAGRPFELLHGVFGARARVVTLALGDERLELTEYLAPQGRPIRADARSHDRDFQHVAIIVSDMDAAYARLRAARVRHASTGPQTLPESIQAAAGIRAFYFRDPDGHFLEVLQFPAGKGAPKWHRRDRLFLGIDHTAVVVEDTDESLRLYRDALGLGVAGTSENFGTEQEHLNNVFGARLRITTLRAGEGPGIELLEYLAPSDGRPAPDDLRANDLLHWQTTLETAALAEAAAALTAGGARRVSPGIVRLDGEGLGFGAGALVRDRDGHALRLVEGPAQPGRTASGLSRKDTQ